MLRAILLARLGKLWTSSNELISHLSSNLEQAEHILVLLSQKEHENIQSQTSTNPSQTTHTYLPSAPSDIFSCNQDEQLLTPYASLAMSRVSLRPIDPLVEADLIASLSANSLKLALNQSAGKSYNMAPKAAPAARAGSNLASQRIALLKDTISLKFKLIRLESQDYNAKEAELKSRHEQQVHDLEAQILKLKNDHRQQQNELYSRHMEEKTRLYREKEREETEMKRWEQTSTGASVNSGALTDAKVVDSSITNNTLPKLTLVRKRKLHFTEDETVSKIPHVGGVGLSGDGSLLRSDDNHKVTSLSHSDELGRNMKDVEKRNSKRMNLEDQVHDTEIGHAAEEEQVNLDFSQLRAEYSDDEEEEDMTEKYNAKEDHDHGGIWTIQPDEDPRFWLRKYQGSKIRIFPPNQKDVDILDWRDLPYIFDLNMPEVTNRKSHKSLYSSTDEIRNAVVIARDLELTFNGQANFYDAKDRHNEACDCRSTKGQPMLKPCEGMIPHLYNSLMEVRITSPLNAGVCREVPELIGVSATWYQARHRSQAKSSGSRACSRPQRAAQVSNEVIAKRMGIPLWQWLKLKRTTKGIRMFGNAKVDERVKVLLGQSTGRTARQTGIKSYFQKDQAGNGQEKDAMDEDEDDLIMDPKDPRWL